MGSVQEFLAGRSRQTEQQRHWVTESLNPSFQFFLQQTCKKRWLLFVIVGFFLTKPK